ncbi:MAG: MFS transporter [Candidatus Eisenbacteria bacterium]|uniref:MFS transporter n=1 Tax=Eiseniibacteriota bacterium TaxID=2212470 RepID=A0A538T446_UNCEI|nr:MAG: MFS transporter [Candidatus Eisenbacteria bacterium]
MLRWLDSVFPRRALFQRDRRLLHLFLGRVLASTGFAIVIPFLSLYLHGERHVPMSAVGAIFFFAALAGALGQVVGGELTDRLGRKVVIVGTQIVRAGAFVALGAAVLVHAPIIWFGLLTAVSALAGRAFEPPSGAMVADIAAGSARSEYYAILRIGGNLGWALGPAIGGFLAALSYPTLFMIAALVLLASGVFMAVKVEETSPHRLTHSLEAQEAATILPSSPGTAPLARFGLEQLGHALRDATFVRYCVVSLLLFTVMSQLISTLSVYSVQWAGISKVELGALYTLNGLMVVFLQFPIVRVLTPYRMTTALVAGSILYALGYAMMGLGRGLPLLSIAMFVVTTGEIVTTPASMNLVANFSTVSLRGRYMGVYGLFNSFGWSIGPLIGGVLLDLASGRSMLLWTPIGCLALVAAAGYWDLRRRIDRAMDLNYEYSAGETATA